MKTQITSEDGLVTSQVDEAQKVTVSFEHSLTEFGNGPKASIHVQVPVPIDATIEDVEAAVKAQYAFAQASVYNALGVPFSQENGRIVPQLPELAPKQQTSRSGSSRSNGGSRSGSSRSSGGSTRKKMSPEELEARKEAAWQDLIENPDGWWDNSRPEDKKNPDGPDYKAKKDNREFGGDRAFGLWLDGAPEWAKLALEHGAS